jgi:phosphate transport system protein
MNTIREEYLFRLVEEFKNMSDMVIRQIDLVKQLLVDKITADKLEIIKANELELDRFEITLRSDIINSLVLQTPRATDLRRIISYMDMITDLERIGDLLYSVSKKISKINTDEMVYSNLRSDVVKLYVLATAMVKSAIASFIYEDSQMARKVIDSDDEVDNLNWEIQRKLFSQTETEKSSAFIADLLSLGRIIYNIERIGDSSTNICEAVIFLTEGKDIRHNH